MNVQAKKQIKNVPVRGGLQNLSPKTMVMIVLVSVMAILWGRVLLRGKSGPESVQAQEKDPLQQQLTQAQSAPAVEIEPVSLPQWPGRNDALSRNFFSEEHLMPTGSGGSANSQSGDVEINTSDESIEHAHRLKLEQIAKRLLLEAVIEDAEGHPIRAFVEGKILSVGSVLTVQEGPNRYELTVEQINEKEIVFSWNSVSVVLKMPETFEF